MKDRIFVDSNIVVYVFDKDLSKKKTAIDIIHLNPMLSSQVIIESLNACIRKLKLSKKISFKNAEYLMKNCQFMFINTTTFTKAFKISLKYNYSYLDSLIIATALENNCSTLYSEDMQHGQMIDNKLKIVNPFKIDTKQLLNKGKF